MGKFRPAVVLTMNEMLPGAVPRYSPSMPRASVMRGAMVPQNLPG